MATRTLEDRVGVLEREITQLKSQLADNGARADWEKIFGTFANSEGFEDAMRLGREYRESLRPKDESPG